MSNGKRILIAGYYGFGNVGDEAILSAMLADLRQQPERLEFVVISANPGETAASHRVEAIDWKEIEALLHAARECDLILLGGGGLFQDYWGVPEDTALTPSHWGISYCHAIGMLAVLYQKPFMIYGVGVGPLASEEGKRLTRLTFDLAQVATVRDRESKDLLISLGVDQEKIAVVPDPAITHEIDSSSAAEILRSHGLEPRERPLLAVCLRNWGEGQEANQWKREVAASLDQFLDAHDAHILFLPFQVQGHALEDDHAVAQKVISLMERQERVSVFSRAYSPAVVGGILSQCKLVVGMRLHSLIFAANAGIAPVALVYDPKVRNFMGSLGLSEYALDLPSMTARLFSEALHNAWEKREETQRAMEIQVGELKALAAETPHRAVRLLEPGLKPPFEREALQSLAIEQTRALAKKEQDVQTLLSRVREQDEQVAAQQHQLNQILYSKTWRLAQTFRAVRLSLLPVASRRERWTRALYRSASELSHRSRKAGGLIRTSVQRHGFLPAAGKGFRILGIRLYHINKKLLHRNQYQRELKQLETLISEHTGFFDLFHVPMGWNTVLFQRFQHISLQTAKLGGLAFYGGHPVVDREMTVYQKVRDNLYVFDATNPQIVAHLFHALNQKDQPRLLRIQSIDLVTTVEDVQQFLQDGFTVIYEYIDEISNAITGSVPDAVYRRHVELLRDERVMVVATADQLLETVQRYRSRNFLLSTNGVDLDHWRTPKGEPPADLKPALSGKLIIGYHGALAKWMDYDLLRAIADEGSYELVLIGHEHDSAFAESGLRGHPRVHFLGSKPYFELNAYAVHYDIAILPFKKMELTQAVSPVKIFEYMAARKPIVTTDLRECRKYRSCLIAETHEDFMAQLQRAATLRTDVTYLGVLDEEAENNSWQKKTQEILRRAGVRL